MPIIGCDYHLLPANCICGHREPGSAENGGLGHREEVLRHVASGKANKIVADKLEISEETVKAHMRKILSKLGANDRTHAVAIALKRGIIEI